MELVSLIGPHYKIECLAPADSDNSFIIVVSRLRDDLDALLPSLSRKTALLKPLKFLEAKED
jgi:hypothetical protein